MIISFKLGGLEYAMMVLQISRSSLRSSPQVLLYISRILRRGISFGWYSQWMKIVSFVSLVSSVVSIIGGGSGSIGGSLFLILESAARM